MARCEVQLPGSVPYRQAWDWQNRLVEERSRAGAPDRLLLLEHPHVYTLGSTGHDAHLLWPPETCARLGIGIVHVDRGGDVTYHGPGQLVGYPIIALPRLEPSGLRADFTGYVRRLEAVVIDTLADFGIAGKRISGLTGVWVDTPPGEAKICAIGVRINTRAVTKHGFALNVNTDLGYFEGIVPCGIADKGVTSMAALLGAPVDMARVVERVIAHFGSVFGFEMVTMQLSRERQESHNTVG